MIWMLTPLLWLPGCDKTAGDSSAGPTQPPGDSGLTGDSDDSPGQPGDDDSAGDEDSAAGEDSEAPPEEPTFMEGLEDLYGVPNIDDDDQNGREDWEDNLSSLVSSENDLIALEFSQEWMDSLLEGETLEVSLSGETSGIRIWEGSSLILGGSAATSLSISAGASATSWAIEFSTFLVEGQLTLQHLDSAGQLLEERSLHLQAAPLILNHHLQYGRDTWAMAVSYRYGGQSYDNDAMMESFQNKLGSSFHTLDQNTYSYDVWVQDEIEFGTLTASDGHMVDVIIDSIRNGGLDRLPEREFEGPDFIRITWGSGRATSQDSFGNLETSPPVVVDGVDYPFGRSYWGERMAYNKGPTSALKTALQEMKVQDPFELDVGFLCVGHVDEWMSFIPDSSSSKGFTLVYSDIDLGYEFLESMSGSTRLSKYQSAHGYSTVSAILNDSALRMLNEEYRDDYLEPNLEILMEELDLDESDVTRIPAIFEEVRGCGGTGAALIPGTANMTIFQASESESVQLFLPDPFLREDEDNLSSDPFVQELESLLPPDQLFHWVDDWEIYHEGLGEVHCGTNVTRTPADATWWDDARHLLGGK